jgi:hypothetical protein
MAPLPSPHCGSSDSCRWRTWLGAGRGGGSVGSGLALLGVYIWLVLTGYLLYYAGADDAFRAAVSLGHWTVGLAALIFLLLHRRIRRSAGGRD